MSLVDVIFLALAQSDNIKRLLLYVKLRKYNCNFQNGNWKIIKSVPLALHIFSFHYQLYFKAPQFQLNHQAKFESRKVFFNTIFIGPSLSYIWAAIANFMMWGFAYSLSGSESAIITNARKPWLGTFALELVVCCRVKLGHSPQVHNSFLSEFLPY